MALNAVRCVKCVMCFVSILTMLGGSALLGIGVWAFLFRSYLENFFGHSMYGITDFILVAAGAAIIFLSFLGCYGSKREVKWMLILYFLVLLILCLLVIAAGILSCMFTSQLRETLLKRMRSSVPFYGEKRYVTTVWDHAQEHLKCCGLKEGTNDSYTIWQRENKFFKENTTVVPDSCCKKKDPESIKACNANPKELTHNEDCHEKLVIFAKENAILLGALGFGVAVVLVTGMVMSCFLIRLIDSKKLDYD